MSTPARRFTAVAAILALLILSGIASLAAQQPAGGRGNAAPPDHARYIAAR